MDERGFYMILPSNVQPDYHLDNTASSYLTTFPTSYQLSGGEWEVALTEVSYVNSMPTINAETFSINSSTLDTDATTYSFKVTNALYLPQAERKRREEVKARQAEAKRRRVEGGGGANAEEKTEEEEEEDGLNALKGMKNCPKFEAIDSNCPFTITFNKTTERIEITAVKGDVEPNVYLYTPYVDILKLRQSKARQVQLEDEKYTQLWSKTLKRGKTYTSTATPGALPAALETLDFKVKNTECLSIAVNKGYYPDPEKLVEALNQETKNPLANFDESEKTEGKKACGYRFGYSKSENRIILGLSKYTDITFNNNLHYILGFKHDKYNQQRVKAEYPPSMHQGIFHLYIYCDLCAPVRVGNVLVPLLRAVEIPSGEKWGKVTSVRFQRPMYLPVNKSCFNSVKIELYDDTGRPILFQEGRTVVTLHLRPRRL